MSDFDDNENIKWPELNDHSGTGNASMAPLPVTNTGRSGFGFDGGEDSRAPSRTNTYDTSTADLHHEDTYAVPPLPHLNPNQPYRDDPNAVGAYYDPYHGPVPQTFNDVPQQEWGHEAIPMTQMAVPGRASSGPQAGRMSPGPQAAYAAGRASPGPQAAYGRASPGPQAAYGASGRMSPGPQAAYGL
ncbi:hypothetical protein FB45DRAFT_928415 [Roridomyces roridus]|uniref:Uncharacterized protein n=1 Tax=Roridomyces roridus TaxID=1738132 RepID=A0AAD7BHP8_9AGAR|nr:hypothetical protein FB45DRAFT_928415 [Roridomyces roridus]